MPSGKKVFRYHYKRDGRSRWATVGAWGAYNLREARIEARELRRKVSKGSDPLAEKKSEEKARAEAPTMAYLADRFLKEYAATKSDSTARNYAIAFNRHIVPALGHKKLVDLTRRDFLRLHADISKPTPTTANRVIATASSAFAWATTVGLLPEDAVNPAKLPRGRKNPERKDRGQALAENEMQRLGTALQDETGPQADALRVYLLSGARPDEILSLKWKDIHEDGRRIKLPASKTGPRMLFLGTNSAKIIADRMKESEWVFASTHHRNRGGKIGSLRSIWDRVKERADLDKSIRLYDAGRHSFISKGYELGYAEHVVRRLAGHAESHFGAHGRYRHVKPSILLDAADRICENLIAEMNGQKIAEAS